MPHRERSPQAPSFGAQECLRIIHWFRTMHTAAVQMNGVGGPAWMHPTHTKGTAAASALSWDARCGAMCTNTPATHASLDLGG